MPVARNTMEIGEMVIGRGLSAAISGFFVAPGLPRRRSSARSQGVRTVPKHSRTLGPGMDERMFPRILAHWQHESAYLNNRGQPLALRFEGHSPTFRSLVRAAVPGADASRMLGALKRYRLVSQSPRGREAPCRWLLPARWAAGIIAGYDSRLTRSADGYLLREPAR